MSGTKNKSSKKQSQSSWTLCEKCNGYFLTKPDLKHECIAQDDLHKQLLSVNIHFVADRLAKLNLIEQSKGGIFFY